LRVHFVVPRAHAPRQQLVPLHQRVDRILDHALGQGRHARNVYQWFQRRLLYQLLRALGYVDCQVADALEVAVHLQRGRDEPQIYGSRLVQRQQPETEFVHIYLQVIYGLFGLEHLVRETRVPLNKRVNRPADGFLHQSAHVQQLLVELSELFVKIFHHCSLPVAPVHRALRQSKRRARAAARAASSVTAREAA
jgi:hypothetical protein